MRALTAPQRPGLARTRPPRPGFTSPVSPEASCPASLPPAAGLQAPCVLNSPAPQRSPGWGAGGKMETGGWRRMHLSPASHPCVACPGQDGPPFLSPSLNSTWPWWAFLILLGSTGPLEPGLLPGSPTHRKGQWGCTGRDIQTRETARCHIPFPLFLPRCPLFLPPFGMHQVLVTYRILALFSEGRLVPTTLDAPSRGKRGRVPS